MSPHRPHLLGTSSIRSKCKNNIGLSHILPIYPLSWMYMLHVYLFLRNTEKKLNIRNTRALYCYFWVLKSNGNTCIHIYILHKLLGIYVYIQNPINQDKLPNTQTPFRIRILTSWSHTFYRKNIYSVCFPFRNPGKHAVSIYLAYQNRKRETWYLYTHHMVYRICWRKILPYSTHR